MFPMCWGLVKQPLYLKKDKMKISEIKLNKKNPRLIKDYKFEKLKKSISEFPKMLELRPIIIDNDNIILGGNMRYQALKDLGYKELPENWVKKSSELSEEEKQRFIISDNINFGEFDFEIIANEWDTELLADWGLDVGGFDVNSDDLGTDFTLPDGDKAPFQQMTFTLADEQAEILKAELDKVKKSEEFKYVETFGNENSNGNALYLLIMNKKK
jgi:hypothetical protein